MAGHRGEPGGSIALSFDVLGAGGGDTERLAERQGGKRQSQLVAGGGKHYIVVKRDLLQQLDL